MSILPRRTKCYNVKFNIEITFARRRQNVTKENNAYAVLEMALSIESDYTSLIETNEGENSTT